MTAQPTTYQIVKSQNHDTIQFTDRSGASLGEDRLDMTINRRNDEITFSAPYAGPDGDDSYTIIIMEADVLLAALRNVGLI
jgi:hypothetical protein